MAAGDVTCNISKPSGKGLYFDGGAAKVTVPDAADIRLRTALTLMCWVKQDSTQAVNWTKIFTKGDDKTYTLASCRGAAKTADFRLWISTVEKSVVAGDIHDDAWHLLIGTYDGELQSIYLDGALANSAVVSGQVDNNVADLIIGGGNAGANMFKGILSEVRLYNRAITAAEVTSLYAGKEIHTRGLVAQYTFNNTSDTGHDDSGNGNNGTPAGGVACRGGENTIEDDVYSTRVDINSDWGFIPLADGKQMMTVHIEN